MLKKYLYIAYKKHTKVFGFILKVYFWNQMYFTLLSAFIYLKQNTEKKQNNKFFHFNKRIKYIVYEQQLIKNNLIKKLKNRRKRLYMLINDKKIIEINAFFKSRQKKKKLYIAYKKWRFIKLQFKKKNSIRIKSKYKPNKNVTLNVGKQKKITVFKNSWIQKSQLTQYKVIKKMSLPSFKKLFVLWQRKNINVQFTKNLSLLNNNSKKRYSILANLITYILLRVKKKNLIKKLRKFFFIRPKMFIRLKNTKRAVTERVQLSCDYYPKPQKTLKQVYRKCFDKKLKYEQQNIKNFFIKLLLKNTSLKKYKTMFFRKIINLTKNNSTLNNEYNSIQIDNLSLLNTNTYKNNKHNYNLVNLLKLINTNKTNATRINFIKNKLHSNSIKKSTPNENNYTPLTFYTNSANTFNTMTNNKNNDCVNLLNKTNTTKYKNFILFYLLSFLENYVNKKIWVKLDMKNIFNIFWVNFIKTFVKKHGYMYRRFSKFILIQELLEVIILTLKKKDLQIMLLYIKQKLECAHFKRHKKLLSIFFDVMRKNKIIFDLTGTKGFSFDIRGKVGVTGNAKKRHIFFSIGKISTTSQNFKSQWQQINIWTSTGQMGVTCLLQF